MNTSLSQAYDNAERSRKALIAFGHLPKDPYDIARANEALGLPTPAAVFAKEVDPNGVAANAPGSKLDAGKARPRLVLGEFSRALEAVTDIGTFGARKYTPRGWVEVKDGIERYADAAERHALTANKGIVWDTDDGLKGGPVTKGGTGGRHRAQVIWNLLAELELTLRAEEKA